MDEETHVYARQRILASQPSLADLDHDFSTRHWWFVVVHTHLQWRHSLDR